MEGFSIRLSEILSNYTYDALKQITKKINSSAMKKAEMISSIISFLVKPENHEKLSQVFSGGIYSELQKILPDKDLKCICDDVWKNSALVLCSSCNKKQHSSCLNSLVFMKKYECVACQLIKLNPSDQVLEFLVPPFLVPEGRCKNRSFVYSSTIKKEVSEFSLGIEVQCRCIKVESPGFSICWPKTGALALNNKSIIEFSGKKSKKETSLDISILLRLGNNEISFSQKTDREDFCLAIVKVRKIPVNSLYSNLSEKKLDVEECEKFIKSFFSGDHELAGSSVKISLKCQFTLQPIRTPSRGKECAHAACFDLFNLIELQQIEKYTWKCPICAGPVYDLYVDSYILDIVNKYLPRKLESVEISEDGRVLPEFKEDEQGTSNKRSVSREMLKGKKAIRGQIEIISLDDKKNSNIILIED